MARGSFPGFFTYTLYLFPRYARPFLAFMAASGISQISDALLSLVYTDRDLIRQRKEADIRHTPTPTSRSIVR
jgi:hypothetical protein